MQNLKSQFNTPTITSLKELIQVISTQHDDFDEESKMLSKIKSDVINILIDRATKKLPDHIVALFDENITYYVNPTGKLQLVAHTETQDLPVEKLLLTPMVEKGHGGGAFSEKTHQK